MVGLLVAVAPIRKRFMAGQGAFLEDEEGLAVSRSAFRRMRKEQKRELMVLWFHRNFEDPAQRTSYVSAEGGYLWNHGGPYDAREQLSDMFGDIVSDAFVEEVANEVEEDGITDWAGTSEHEDENDYYEEPPRSPTLDSFSDEPSARYGSAEEHEARAQAIAALDRLREIVDRPRSVGIGHNRPPENIDEEYAEVIELRPALIELRTEFAKSAPVIKLVKQFAKPLFNSLIASGKWIGRKLDIAANAAAAASGTAIAVHVAAHYSEPLNTALDAILKWLEIAARHII